MNQDNDLQQNLTFNATASLSSLQINTPDWSYISPQLSLSNDVSLGNCRMSWPVIRHTQTAWEHPGNKQMLLRETPFARK